ncbi:hypothetical protein Dimus_013541 [Dionaea muscipula]
MVNAEDHSELGESGAVVAGVVLSTASSPACSPDERERWWCFGEALSVEGMEVGVALSDAKVADAALVSPLVEVIISPATLSGAIDIFSGGLVSEEGQGPPAIREALRLQPTDGLRQPPRSPEEPLPVRVGEPTDDGGLPPADVAL